jgi:branched-chain amino acid transport system permease protein
MSSPASTAGRAARPGAALSALAPWLAAAVVLALLPRVFDSGLSLTTMSLMGTMVIFALSYNMLLGQTGLLSFGHAVYYGLGGFMTVHLMNLVEAAGLPVPLALFPLAGGLAGLLFAALFGSVATRRAGTAFAMITLGLCELVASAALILQHVFGGEQGVGTDRTALVHPFGISFGPQLQVYYLIAFWGLVSAAAMYALTRTPFGRMCRAVRDNPERARFIGFDIQAVRFLAFTFSGGFAGVAGALAAINFELMSSSQLGLRQSGAVILMTFIGGTGDFAGPILGAVLVTWLQVSLSDVTDLWRLYLGLLFIGVVMFAPEGLAGVLRRQWPLLAARRLHRVLPAYAAALLAGLMLAAGCSLALEMTNQLMVHASDGPAMRFAFVRLSAASPLPWCAAALLALAGAGLLLKAVPWVRAAYAQALAAAPGGRATT